MNVGTAVLADLLSITARQVQSLENEGVLVKSGAGKWALAENIRAYLKNRIEAERTRIDRGAGDARSKQLKSDDLELRIEIRSRKLVHEAKSEALGVIDDMAGSLRVDLLSLPARLTSDVTLRRRMEDGINDAFGAAAARSAAEATRLAEARSAVATDPEDDARPVDKAKPNVPSKRRRPRAA